MLDENKGNVVQSEPGTKGMNDGDLRCTQTGIVRNRRKVTNWIEHPSVVQLDTRKVTPWKKSVVGRKKVGKGVRDGCGVGALRSAEQSVGAVLAQELPAHAARLVRAPHANHCVGVRECEAKLFGMNGQLWNRTFHVVPLEDGPVDGLNSTSHTETAVGCNRPLGGVACTLHRRRL